MGTADTVQSLNKGATIILASELNKDLKYFPESLKRILSDSMLPTVLIIAPKIFSGAYNYLVRYS